MATNDKLIKVTDLKKHYNKGTIKALDGITVDTIRDLLSVDRDAWKADVENIKEFYALVGDRVPAALKEELAALEQRLG